MRTAVPGGRNAGRAELGVAAGYRQQVVTERTAAVPNAALWFTNRFSNGRGLFGAIISGQYTAGGSVGAGLVGGLRLHEAATTYAWIDFEFGWPWAALSVPAGLALTADLWLYSAPGFVFGEMPGPLSGRDPLFVRLPLGVTWRVTDGGADIRFEAGGLVADFGDLTQGTHVYVSIGIADGVNQ